MYHAQLGRFVSRDPVGYEQGANLFSYTANAPIGLLDPTGQEWQVDRANGVRARAVCCDDTVRGLAALIGLDAKDYRHWLKPRVGSALPTSTTEVIREGECYIPNTIIAYWGGAYGWAGKLVVNWWGSINYLEELGFNVDAYDHVPGKTLALQDLLVRYNEAGLVHGLFFWGHGHKSKGGGRLYSHSADLVLVADALLLDYKLAFGAVYACRSDTAEQGLSSGSPGHIWHGYSGILIPGLSHLPLYVSHGDQETRDDTLEPPVVFP